MALNSLPIRTKVNGVNRYVNSQGNTVFSNTPEDDQSLTQKAPILGGGTSPQQRYDNGTNSFAPENGQSLPSIQNGKLVQAGDSSALPSLPERPDQAKQVVDPNAIPSIQGGKLVQPMMTQATDALSLPAKQVGNGDAVSSIRDGKLQQAPQLPQYQPNQITGNAATQDAIANNIKIGQQPITGMQSALAAKYAHLQNADLLSNDVANQQIQQRNNEQGQQASQVAQELSDKRYQAGQDDYRAILSGNQQSNQFNQEMALKNKVSGVDYLSKLAGSKAEAELPAKQAEFDMKNRSELQKAEAMSPIDAQKKVMEGQLVAKQGIPQVESDYQYANSLVNDLVNHKGKSGVVGVPGISGLSHLPGTDEADFRARLDQIQGKQFLSAFDSLKGGGQITEIEGKKATQAIARMNESQSEDEFNKSAAEFQDVLSTARKNAYGKAGLDLPSEQKNDNTKLQKMPAGFEGFTQEQYDRFNKQHGGN